MQPGPPCDFPGLPAPADRGSGGPLRICVVTSDVSGPGEVGLAMATLAGTLARAGHDTTALLLPEPGTTAAPGPWESRGVRPIPLVPRDSRPGAWLRAVAYEVYRWLRDQRFDLVHFHDWRGHGFYALIARQQGLAFADTRLVVLAQGPSLWRKLGQGGYVDRLDDLEVDYMEQESVARADAVISPSQHLLAWMREQGWRLPERCHVQANLQEVDAPAATDRTPRPVREIVYASRLDEGGGLVLFCDALDRLARREPPPMRVAFLGEPGVVGGRDARDYVRDRAAAWPFPCELVDAPALDYLRGEGRLAVLPALMENAPAAVSAWLAAGLPFLASQAGGLPELIAADDRPQTLFRLRAEPLAQRLLQALHDGVRPARPAVDAGTNRQTWLAWHTGLSRGTPAPAAAASCRRPLVSVCIPHFNRPTLLAQALASLEAQDYKPFEVLVVDDGSTQPEALRYLQEVETRYAGRGWRVLRQANRFQGAARNTAARHARGEYLLFMDDDNVAEPHEITTFVRVAEATGADVLTAPGYLFRGPQPPDRDHPPSELMLPLGAATAAGALYNFFGDTNALVRREAYLALGGMTEDYGIIHEDWEFFARAVLQGLRLEVVPEPLFWYRVSLDSASFTTPARLNYVRNLRPYLDSVPPELRGLVLYCQGARFRIDSLIAEHGALYQYTVNLEQQQAALRQQHEELRRWCLHLEEQHRQLQQQCETLRSRRPRLRRRAAATMRALLTRLSLVRPAARDKS